MHRKLNRDNLAAIGLVASEWARFEEQVSLNTALLVLGEPIVPAWLVTMGASPDYLLPRARAYMTLVLSSAKASDFLRRFDALNARVGVARTQRNRIVHSVWEQISADTLTTAPLKLRGKAFDFERSTVTRREMLAVAGEIHQLVADVSELLIEAGWARDAEIDEDG